MIIVYFLILPHLSSVSFPSLESWEARVESRIIWTLQSVCFSHFYFPFLRHNWRLSSPLESCVCVCVYMFTWRFCKREKGSYAIVCLRLWLLYYIYFPFTSVILFTIAINQTTTTNNIIVVVVVILTHRYSITTTIPRLLRLKHFAQDLVWCVFVCALCHTHRLLCIGETWKNIENKQLELYSFSYSFIN